MLDRAEALFVNNPGSWADPNLVAPMIAPGLRTETARRLLTSPRLAERASRLLAERLGAGDPATLEPVDRVLAGSAVATLETVALAAGAVWHAGRVRALVLGADIALLCARFGDGTRDAALRHADLAPDERHLSAAGQDTLDGAEALADDIQRDGARCMAAWIDVLPAWAAARVRLKWPHTESRMDEAARACAVPIVRTIAAEMLAV
jgi:hypothetical protein